MKKCSFSRKAHTSNDILELVHTSLCGLIGVDSYYGDTYFILFVDDYSRMMTIMFMKRHLYAPRTPQKNVISKR